MIINAKKTLQISNHLYKQKIIGEHLDKLNARIYIYICIYHASKH